MFGSTNIVKNNGKSKWVYSDCGIAFDGLGSWRSGNDFARNVIIFGVDNSSSFQTDNSQDSFLILGEGPTDDINGSIGAPEKKSLVSILVKRRQNFARVWITILIIVFFFITEKNL